MGTIVTSRPHADINVCDCVLIVGHQKIHYCQTKDSLLTNGFFEDTNKEKEFRRDIVDSSGTVFTKETEACSIHYVFEGNQQTPVLILLIMGEAQFHRFKKLNKPVQIGAMEWTLDCYSMIVVENHAYNIWLSIRD